MQEIFYEETSIVQNEESENKKYNGLNALSFVFFLLIPLTFFIVFTSYNFSNYPLLGVLIMIVPIAIFLTLGIVLGRKKNKYCVDYDYTFISGSIRISQVIKKVKRKFVIEFEAREIERLGKYGSETFKRYESMPITKTVLTSNDTPAENKEFYYFVVNTAGEKQLLTMELTEKFIGTILKFSNKNILDDDFARELRQRKQ